jgi:N-acetyl-gamma-glutamyl-phosphate reductase
MIKVKVVGCGGYGGVGIVELLLRHPEAKIRTLVAATETGMPMSELYPHLKGFCDLPILKPDDPAAQEPADVVFFSTPDGVGMVQAPAELAKGARVIDYSGDFRFDNVADYAEYARRIGRDPVHKTPELLPQTVYGLPELNRKAYGRDRKLVGNPGCFAMSCLIGLAPAAAAKLVDFSSVICDCKTGVSGAGKKATPAHHYPARYENMGAYRLSGHQHVMEVERMLGGLAGEARAGDLHRAGRARLPRHPELPLRHAPRRHRPAAGLGGLFRILQRQPLRAPVRFQGRDRHRPRARHQLLQPRRGRG